MNKELSVEEIKNNTVWVVKMVSGRLTGTYEELLPYINSEDCRDFDVCVTQKDPEIQKFWNDCWEYEDKHHCWMTVDEFYEIWANS